MKIKQFLKSVGMSEEDVLIQVSYERNRSIDFIREFRNQLQEDKNLLMNVKKDKEAVGDSTLYNVHTNLMARSYRGTPTISFQETKENIHKEQQRRDSGEIDEQEYEEKYEAIMDNFRLMTQIILNSR